MIYISLKTSIIYDVKSLPNFVHRTQYKYNHLLIKIYFEKYFSKIYKILQHWQNYIFSYIKFFYIILWNTSMLFILQDCRQKFQGGSFFDHEGLPYCETHYHAKRGSLCAGCHKPITGEYTRFLKLKIFNMILICFFLHFVLFCRSLHNSNVPQIPSRALRVCILPKTIEQGHVQGAKRQALLPWLLWQTLRINNLYFSELFFL